MLDCTRLFECDRPKQARAYFSRHSRTNIFVLLMVLLLLLLLLLLHHIVKWCDKRPPENVGVCRCGAVKVKLWGAPSSLVLEDQQGNVIDWNIEYKGNYVVLRLTNMNKSMPDTNTNIHLFIGHPFNHWPTNQPTNQPIKRESDNWTIILEQGKKWNTSFIRLAESHKVSKWFITINRFPHLPHVGPLSL